MKETSIKPHFQGQKIFSVFRRKVRSEYIRFERKVKCFSPNSLHLSYIDPKADLKCSGKFDRSQELWLNVEGDLFKWLRNVILSEEVERRIRQMKTEKKSISDFLPEHPPQTMVQGRVPVEVAEQVRLIMEKENRSWSEVLTACLQWFVQEKEDNS